MQASSHCQVKWSRGIQESSNFGAARRMLPAPKEKHCCILPAMPLLVLVCLLAAWGSAWAQTEQVGVFHETATGLTMRYPVELTVRDAQKRIEEGHVAVFGSMLNEASAHELASRCIKPLLLAELNRGSQENESSAASSATLLMFEFVASKECKAGFRYKDDEKVAGGVAQTAIQLSGATALS